jgi:hypothetical protein
MFLNSIVLPFLMVAEVVLMADADDGLMACSSLLNSYGIAG